MAVNLEDAEVDEVVQFAATCEYILIALDNYDGREEKKHVDFEVGNDWNQEKLEVHDKIPVGHDFLAELEVNTECDLLLQRKVLHEVAEQTHDQVADHSCNQEQPHLTPDSFVFEVVAGPHFKQENRKHDDYCYEKHALEYFIVEILIPISEILHQQLVQRKNEKHHGSKHVGESFLPLLELLDRV